MKNCLNDLLTISSSFSCFLLIDTSSEITHKNALSCLRELWCDDTQPSERNLLSMRWNNKNTNVSSAELLLGAGKRLQNKGWAGVGWGEREERGGRKRMYPQRSCGVSNMALVLCKKKSKIEQINSDHQIPPISFSSPCPHGLKLKGDADGATQTHMDYAHMVPVLPSGWAWSKCWWIFWISWLSLWWCDNKNNKTTFFFFFFFF